MQKEIAEFELLGQALFNALKTDAVDPREYGWNQEQRLVGPKGKVFETFRGFMRENHLLSLLDKKTRKPLPNIKLTDIRGTLEIAKTGLPASEG